MYRQATMTPIAFEESYNSTYCGELRRTYDWQDLARAVLAMGADTIDDPPREITPAGVGDETWGTTLFCFSVVLPTEESRAMAQNIKSAGKSICRCDQYTFVNAPDGTATSGVEPYLKAWQLVRDQEFWGQHDWTVKADLEAVFFPSRLRMHVAELRSPRKALYLRNRDTIGHLDGSLEVLSQSATRLLLLRMETCGELAKHLGREDAWLVDCLEFIGVDYMIDYLLLGDGVSDCDRTQVVAYPFRSTVEEWNACVTLAEGMDAADG